MVRKKIGRVACSINDFNEYFQDLSVVGEQSDKFKQYFVRNEWHVKVNPKKMYGGRLLITIDALVIRKIPFLSPSLWEKRREGRKGSHPSIPREMQYFCKN